MPDPKCEELTRFFKKISALLRYNGHTSMKLFLMCKANSVVDRLLGVQDYPGSDLEMNSVAKQTFIKLLF